MGRKERRAKAPRSKVENLHRPVKGNKGVLAAIAIFVVIAVIATYFIRFSAG
jgi:hypothetical protein